MSLTEKFNEAANRVRNFNKRPEENDLLDLYSYFKQATIGDCNTEKPAITDIESGKKWKAWMSRRGMDKDEAKKIYIKCSEDLNKIYA